MNAHLKRTGPAIEAHYQFLLWLVPSARVSAPSSVGSAINKPIDVLSRLKRPVFDARAARSGSARRTPPRMRRLPARDWRTLAASFASRSPPSRHETNVGKSPLLTLSGPAATKH